jgi:hypothetical protein
MAGNEICFLPSSLQQTATLSSVRHTVHEASKAKQKQKQSNNLNLDRLPPPSTPTALMNRILVGVFHFRFLAVLLSIDWFGSPGGFVAQSLSVLISSIKYT